MQVQLRKKNETGWTQVAILERVDSFNFFELESMLSELKSQSVKMIAVDLRSTQFLSFKAIRHLCDVAMQLRSEGGRLALVSPSEKLKRQIDIYASLEPMDLYRSSQEIPEATN